MKIYNISDMHLMSRRNIKKLDDVIMGRLRDFLSKVENDSVVTIAGDLFDVPVINSFKNYDYLNKLITLFNEEANRGIRFLILKGNHDYFYDVENDNEIGLFSVLSTVYNLEKDYTVEKIQDLPSIIIADEQKSVEIGNVRICLLPYGLGDQFVKTKQGFLNILVCHGTVEIDGLIEEESLIKQETTKKFDFVLKGHIHKSYFYDNIYSSGSFVKKLSGDDNGYLEVDTEKRSCKIKEFKDGFNIRYETAICTKEDINDVLSFLDHNSIASILYKGDPSDIDVDLFNKCFNQCLDFKIIFENDLKNKVDIDDKNNLFMSFDSYLNKNLSKELYSYMKEILRNNEG